MKNRFLFLAFISFVSFSLNAQSLDIAKSESIGMESKKLEAVDQLIENYIQQGAVPGGVFMVARKGKIVYNKAFGQRSLETKAPYKTDDIFRIASMTKAVTTISIMQLYEQGKIGLDDPVHYYIPAFKDIAVLDQFNETDSTFTTVPAQKKITIRHLLTHTSGIIYGSFDSKEMKIIYNQFDLLNVGLSHPSLTTEEMVNKIAQVPLSFQPGEKYTYGLNMEILGRVIEVISGTTLDKYFQENVFQPLEMKDTYFYLPTNKQDRLVPIYTLDQQGKIIMIDPETAAMLDYPKTSGRNHFAGGGGLSSTTMDYMTLIQALLNNGKLNGKRILSRNTIETMTADQMIDLNKTGNGFSNTPGISFCLGFSLHTNEAAGLGPKSPGTYEWGGYFNTKYFIDPEEELVFVGMTQIVPFYRGDFWDRMYAIIYGSIDD